MTRNENDLRDALQGLDQRAVEHGAPSTATILAQATETHLGPAHTAETRRLPRWLPPLAAAAVVAAAAVTAVTLTNGQGDSPAAGRSTAAPTTAPTTASPSTSASAKPTVSPAAAVLDDAATKLAAAPPWTTPDPEDFFYVRTNQVTTWTSVSGKQEGSGRAADGGKVFVPGCKNGHIVSSGESGTCTLNDVPHYLGNAPTTPAAWDRYLERIAPGAKAADAQGKIIVQVLHQDLTAPRASAALLRYTATCPGLHTLSVRPVDGEKLIGVTCTSMSNGSYGLAFDASSHAFVGFVPVTTGGRQNTSAEIVAETGIVAAIGRKP